MLDQWLQNAEGKLNSNLETVRRVGTFSEIHNLSNLPSMHSLETLKFLKKTCPPNEKEKYTKPQDPQSRLEKRKGKKKPNETKKTLEASQNGNWVTYSHTKEYEMKNGIKAKKRTLRPKKCIPRELGHELKHGHKDTQNGRCWRSEPARHGKEEHSYSCFQNVNILLVQKTKFKESREWALTNRKRTHPAAFSRLLWPLWTYPDPPCQRLSASRRPHHVVRGLPRGSNREGSIVIPLLRHRLCRLGAGGGLY